MRLPLVSALALGLVFAGSAALIAARATMGPEAAPPGEEVASEEKGEFLWLCWSPVFHVHETARPAELARALAPRLPAGFTMRADEDAGRITFTWVRGDFEALKTLIAVTECRIHDGPVS